MQPKYNFSKKSYQAAGTIEIYLDVTDGIIRHSKIYGDFFAKRDVGEIESALIGVRHNRAEIEKMLTGFCLDDYFLNIPLENLINCFF